MRRTTTALLTAALAASTLAFAPAPTELTTTVQRVEDPCGPWEQGDERQAFLREEVPDVDLCAVEVSTTTDADGVLVGLTLALEVDGEVAPALGRDYVILLEAVEYVPGTVPAGPTNQDNEVESGCTYEFAVVSRLDGTQLRDGLSTCRGSEAAVREETIGFVDGGRPIDNASHVIDGGRLEITVDLTRYDPALAELLERSVDGLRIEAQAGDGRDMVAFAAMVVAPRDDIEPTDLDVSAFGSLPDAVTDPTSPGGPDEPTPCDKVYSPYGEELPATFCTSALGGTLAEDGSLATAVFSATLVEGVDVPSQFAFSLEPFVDESWCRGRLWVELTPAGHAVVSLGSSGCSYATNDDPLGVADDLTRDMLDQFAGTASRPVLDAVVDVDGRTVTVTVPAQPHDENLAAFLRAGRVWSEMVVGVGNGTVVNGWTGITTPGPLGFPG